MMSRSIVRRLAVVLAATAAGAIGGLLLARNRTGPPARSLHDFMIGFAQLGFSPPMVFSVVVWLAFSLYWSSVARNAAPIQSSESWGARKIHEVLIGVSQLLVLIPIPGLRARFLPATPPVIAIGVIVQLASLALAVWSRQVLGRNWSAGVATKVDHQLVRSGPYRLIRHPIYTAVLGLYVG